MKIIIKEHNGYKEWKNLPVDIRKRVRQLFGQFHYFFETKKGVISLVQVLEIFGHRSGEFYWEIGIFDKKGYIKETETYHSIEFAQDRIKEILQ